MISVATSVALAHLLGETRRPPDALREEKPVSSRMLQYETWNRIHGYRIDSSRHESVRELLARFAFVELERQVLERVLDPLPQSVRILDAIHLASALFLDREVTATPLASYDETMLAAATELGLEIYPLP